MEDDLPSDPADFPELVLLPHLDDEWTEVRLSRRSDGAWEVHVTIRVDDGYRDEAAAQAVADHYRAVLSRSAQTVGGVGAAAAVPPSGRSTQRIG